MYCNLASPWMIRHRWHAVQSCNSTESKWRQKVVAYCTHPVLFLAIERVNFRIFDALVVTDTIPLQDDAAACIAFVSYLLLKSWLKQFAGLANDDSVYSLFID